MRIKALGIPALALAILWAVPADAQSLDVACLNLFERRILAAASVSAVARPLTVRRTVLGIGWDGPENRERERRNPKCLDSHCRALLQPIPHRLQLSHQIEHRYGRSRLTTDLILLTKSLLVQRPNGILPGAPNDRAAEGATVILCTR